MTKRSKFSEDIHQAVLVRALRSAERDGWPLIVEGDQNSAKRGPQAAAIAKLTGLREGAPDVRVLLDKGRILFAELKTECGRLSKAQTDLHEAYRTIGHSVIVSKEAEPLDTALNVIAEVCRLCGWQVHEFTGYAIEAEKQIMDAIGAAK